jgi:hypothetical protein
MIKIRLFSFLAIFNLCLTSLIFSQQIIYDFESWQKSQLYEEPKNFTTLNFQSYFSSLATNVTKIVGVKGNGVRLEATRGILDTTVTPAFITNGDISNIPYGGVPINRMPDSLTGFIRTNFASGDTGVLAIFFKRVGIPISINIFPITQNIPTFTRFSIPLSPSAIAPDTVFFLLSSGSLDRPKQGSWIEIDEINLTNSTIQMPNSSFENWEPIEIEEPLEWATPNLIPTLLRSKIPVTKTTDAFEGNYAMKIENINVNQFGLNQNYGYAGPGEAAFGTISSIPFNSQNIYYNFRYKYAPVLNDTAWLFIQFHKFTQGSRKILNTNLIPITATSNFTPYFNSIDLPETCDSVYIHFFSGSGFYNGIGSGSPKLGSTLIIDDFRIAFKLQGNSSKINQTHFLYPSSSRDEIFIQFDDTKPTNWQLINTQGQALHSQIEQVSEHLWKMDIRTLAIGNYLLIATDNSKRLTFTFQKIE